MAGRQRGIERACLGGTLAHGLAGVARILAAAVAITVASVSSSGPALAQPAPANGIIADGNAVVTGFSGSQPPMTIAPGVNPADQTFIDLGGPAARVIDIQSPGGPPEARLVEAIKPFTVTAGQIGQVFAVALDNATPANIYVAATSAYGLPIVVANARAKQGATNASFMQGLFGPAALQGGPGSIWQIRGTTGEVRLFANVALDGVANPGPALGGLAFDAATNSLFVADRGTGMVHRFDMTGAERSHYDHGMQGRPGAGLPAVPFDPAKRLDIASPQFHTDDPATWGYAPPERRIFGLAVRAGRLYYAIAERLQIWSVAIAPDGTFGADARVEITVPPAQSASEISKITFDDQGRILLAERAAPTGAYDFGTLTQPEVGRVLRYAPAASAAGAAAWQAAPDEYAIGFFGQMQNGNGGVAVGYGYDPAGKLDRNSCGGFLWSTGEQLRVSIDPAIAARLAQGGSAIVNGLQGNGADLVRPANMPPLAGYFVDYDDQFDDTSARGGLGDVAILRTCAPSPGMPEAGPPPAPPAPPPTPGPGEGPVPGLQEGAPDQGAPEEGAPEEDVPEEDDWPELPPPICPPGTHLATNALQCCPPGEIPGLTGACAPICPNGAADPNCWGGFKPGLGPDGAGFAGTCWNNMGPMSICGGPCGPCPSPNIPLCKKCPKSPLKNCPAGFILRTAPPFVPTAGWTWSNATCVPSPVQLTCAPGQQVGLDGACHDICPAGQRAYPVNRCCLDGTAPNALGACGPGILVPPLWYLDFLATGSGPCVPPDCSYYEFTVTGRERFGRGSLTQRITVPPGSAFPEARVTRGSKYCPASRWSCSKAGNVFTCSVEDCGLAPGDQVVVRLEGKVAPDLTEPPPAPIERTACGVLEWQAMSRRRGPAVIEQPGAPSREQRAAEGVSIEQIGGRPTRQACWSIRLVGKTPPPPTCASNYAATADGQCCLRRQMTADGVCCPAGQRPDAWRSTCISTCPADRIWTGTACACPPGTIERRGQCIRHVEPPPPPTCGSDQTGVWPNCCPLGHYWNGRKCVRGTRGCPPDSVGTPPECQCRPPLVGTPGSCIRPVRCPPDSVGTPPECHCRPPLVGTPGSCAKPVVRCPEGQIGRPPHCRPVRCSEGMIGTPPHCRPARCPEGKIGRPPHCRPARCPEGMVGTPPHCRSVRHPVFTPRHPVIRQDHTLRRPAGRRSR